MVIFTIAGRADIAAAASLMQSVRAFHPEPRRIILLADTPGEIGGLDLAAETWSLSRLTDPRVANLRLWYSPAETEAALKPFAFRAILADSDGPALCLDPSAELFAPIDGVLAALADAAAVLVPRLPVPQPNLGPREGIFHAGLIGLAPGAPVAAWLDWWERRLLSDCRAGEDATAPIGQAWLDYAVGFIPDLRILHDRGVAAGVWNLAGNPLSRDADGQGGWRVGGSRLALFDFRGIDQLSPPADSPLAALRAHHRARLRANAPPAAPMLHQLPDGRLITRALRLRLLAAIDEGELDPELPVPLTSPLLDIAETRPIPPPPRFDPGQSPPWPPLSEQVAPHMAAKGALAAWLGSVVSLTIGGVPCRIDVQSALLWERRADLRAHFPLTSPASLEEFLGWCLTNGIAEAGIDPTLFGAAWLAELARTDADPAAPGAGSARPPLTRALRATRHAPVPESYLTRLARHPGHTLAELAHALWVGWVAPTLYRWPASLAAPVRDWLDAPGEVIWQGMALPRGLVALWTLRPDVQQERPLSNARGQGYFVAWALFHGLPELGLAPAALLPEMVARLDRPISLPDVTELALLVRATRVDLREAFDLATADGRAGLAAWAQRHLDQEHPGLRVVPDAVLPTPVQARVLLTGQWSQPNGRGEDVRATAVALRAAGIEDWQIADRDLGILRAPDGTPLPPGTRVRVQINIVHCNADSALEDFLFLRELGVVADRSIGYWAWELPSLPRWWRHAFAFYDEIWAASRFAQAAFAAEGLRPVQLIPMVVRDLPPRPPAGLASLGITAGTSLFLASFDYRSFISRKNPEAVIAAFRAAFPLGDEPVALLLKTQSAHTDQLAVRRLVRLAAADPRIMIRDIILEEAEMAGLVAAAAAYVSLHRSEGFGRGPAEAMRLGVPVILSAYSGTEDFADEDCAWPVPVRMITVPPEAYVGVDGQVWADPDISAAAAAMRAVLADPALAAAKAARGRARIIERYGPAQVGAVLRVALEAGCAAGLAKPPPRR